MLSKLSFASIILLAFLAAAAYFWAWPKGSVLLLHKSETTQLSIKDTYLSVEIADTDQKKAAGLSNREFLAQDAGMLFVYDGPTRPAFWMKEMKFSIDIIWIGEDRQVSEITSNVKPETYPQDFRPRQPVRYVLEVNAGLAEQAALVPGDPVRFDLPGK